MKKALIDLGWALLGWTIIMIAALFVVMEIVSNEYYDVQPGPPPAHEITMEANRHGFFKIQKHNGITVWYERKWRF